MGLPEQIRGLVPLGGLCNSMLKHYKAVTDYHQRVRSRRIYTIALLYNVYGLHVNIVIFFDQNAARVHV